MSLPAERSFLGAVGCWMGGYGCARPPFACDHYCPLSLLLNSHSCLFVCLFVALAEQSTEDMEPLSVGANTLKWIQRVEKLAVIDIIPLSNISCAWFTVKTPNILAALGAARHLSPHSGSRP